MPPFYGINVSVCCGQRVLVGVYRIKNSIQEKGEKVYIFYLEKAFWGENGRGEVKIRKLNFNTTFVE